MTFASSSRTHSVLTGRTHSVLAGLVFVGCLAGSVVSAQQPPRTLTLDDALALAEKASEQVAIANAGAVRAVGGQRLARSERLPQINGALSYDRTLRSEFQGLFDTDQTGGDDGTDFSKLPFGQANVYRVGLQFSQAIFSGGRLRAQARQAGLRRESAVLGVTAARAQTTLDVAEAFYDAALADRLVRIAEETYAQADRSLTSTQEQRSAGRLSEFELLRARVARDSLEPSVVRARNGRALAYLHLKQLLDLPLDEPLALMADLDDTALPPPARFSGRVAEAEAALTAPTRVTVTQAGHEVKIAEQAFAIARSARWPAIGLRSDFGLVNYPDSFPTLEDWRQNWTVGIALSVPLLTGGRTRANELIARAGVEEAGARLRQTQEIAALDEASTRQDLQATRLEWQVSGGTIQQAQRAYEIAELRYNEGLSTQLELADARLQLAQSQVTRAEAARNLQVRRIRFALLPELPLDGSAAGRAAAPGAQAQPQSPVSAQPAMQAAPVIPGAQGGR